MKHLYYLAAAALCSWAPLASSPLLLARDDGTVQDRRSGLAWQKCSHGQRLTGNACEGLASALPLARARAYCSELKLAGRKWRLPNINELSGLADEGRDPPAIDLELFPGTVPYEYWSSSFFLDHQGAWFFVYSFQRSFSFGVQEGVYFVRCVSG